MSVAVTYNRNGATGGSVPVDATAYTAGVSSVTVIGNTGALNLAGYSFAGWNTAANGTGTAYDPGDMFTIAADTTLYATWNSATSLITPTELKEHVSTSLSDAALQRIIDAEEQEIINRFGAHVAQVEEFDEEITGELLYPSRPVLSITSIVEKWVDSFIGGSTSTTLDSTDYEIVSGGKEIRRLSTGTHPLSAWGNRVVLTYVPVVETAKRVMALINLCKINLAYNGLKSESVGGGEYRMDQDAYDAEREKIMATLKTSRRAFA